MKNSKNISTIKAAETMTIAVLFSFAMIITTITVTAAQSDRTFQSEEDGFRLQIPQGWVIEDHDNVSLQPNGEGAAMLCLENEALPGIGGEYNCQAANLSDAIFINRWPDMQSMPEFQNESDDSNDSSSNVIPTTNDLLALWIQSLQNNTSQIQIQNTTDVNDFTKIVDMTYTFHNTAGTILPFDDYSYGVDSSLMFALGQDRNTGYIIGNNVGYNNQTQPQHSPAVQEIFNTFEVVEE